MFEGWYEAREYILPKDLKVSFIRGYNRLRPESHIYCDTMGEIRNNKENRWAINIESEIKDLRVNILEEEEEEGNERVESEGKDYEFTLVYDLIDDRFNLNADPSTVHIGLWPNIDFAYHVLISKTPNTNTIENRTDYESRKCIHGLENEQKKNRNETKRRSKHLPISEIIMNTFKSYEK
ncbi:myb-like protein X [Vespula maculifrons]|uniref:Myb-like protein X n=1 Tax=Vespula maculifrons TaxID=7453 RepID=A0ABD2AJG6_VESMC